jgi:hypothetical protein
MIRRDERWPAVYALTFILSYQYLIISKFFPLFADYSEHSWRVFMRNYHMSGFDPITYSVLSDWHLGYDIVRHPLLAFIMYPLAWLNSILEQFTSVNCAQFLMGALLVFCAFYTFLFFHRILRDVIKIRRLPAFLLTAFFFSMAYIWLTILVADHFCLSLYLLIFILYQSGMKLQRGEYFGITETVLYFTLVAGVTLSNGVLVFLCVWAVNGRSLFRPTFFLKSVVLPSLAMLVFALAVNNTTDKAPSEKENPISEQMEWVDDTVSKAEVLTENYFGESIQLHREHLLGDILMKRPVIVRYTWKIQYGVEALIILLFLSGVWRARHERFLWLLMGILAFNIALHILLGFAINEVYIMSAHWLFVVPLAIAYLFTTGYRRLYDCLLGTVALLTAYLLLYHGYWIHYYLTWPLAL